jgi:hypothetical protein
MVKKLRNLSLLLLGVIGFSRPGSLHAWAPDCSYGADNGFCTGQEMSNCGAYQQTCCGGDNDGGWCTYGNQQVGLILPCHESYSFGVYCSPPPI